MAEIDTQLLKLFQTRYVRNEFEKGGFLNPRMFDYISGEHQEFEFYRMDDAYALEYLHKSETPDVDIQFYVTRLSLTTYTAGYTFDQVTHGEMAYQNALPGILHSLLQGMKRYRDHVILNELMRAFKTGEIKRVIENTVSPQENPLAVSTNNRLSTMQLTDAVSLLNYYGAVPNEELVFIAPSFALYQLMRDEKMTSFDYTSRGIMDNMPKGVGYFGKYMNIDLYGMPQLHIQPGVLGGLTPTNPGTADAYSVGFLLRKGPLSPLLVGEGTSDKFYMSPDAGEQYALKPQFVSKIGARVFKPDDIIAIKFRDITATK